MSTGKIIAELRKQKNWSQTELSNESGISRVMIGKYERDEASPSIEAAKKIADTLGVSLDFLSGKTSIQMDKTNMKRLHDIEALPEEDRLHIFYALDNLIKAAKFKTI